ncbi:MAG TPA: hypothetical protein VGI66_00990 [Streptosporangiaceae bacterium]
MPKFDAGAVVETLEYTFMPFAKVMGEIPEPSDVTIGEFLADIKKVMEAAQEAAGLSEVDQDDAQQVLDALNNLDPGVFVDVMAQMAEIYAKLCSNRPSKSDLLLVPMRARMRFYAWLQQEVVNPEAVPAAGNAQVIDLKRAAGG